MPIIPVDKITKGILWITTTADNRMGSLNGGFHPSLG